MKHIKAISTEGLASHYSVDLVHLPNGQILGVCDDQVCLYASLESFDNCEPCLSVIKLGVDHE